MSGLLRRLTRRRPATADETGSATPESSEPAGAPAETPAEPGGGHPVPAPDDQATEVLPATGEQPTVAAPAESGGEKAPDSGATDQTVVAPEATVAIQQPEPRRDLPAGIDPSELADAPVPSARRGKLRRRLRYLRAVRDLLLRDLGGFAYEVQRTAGGTTEEPHRRLMEAKTNRIAALDTEVRGLEARLAEPHGDALLREPGIGGTCPECGELHASDAHYCSRCGAPLDARARARRDAAVAAAAVQQTTGSHPTAEPAPASVLWAAGPRPERTTEPEPEEESRPSEVTSQWLALPKHGEAEKKPASDAADEKAPVTGWAGAGGEAASEPAAEPAPAKPKRPRASRAKKPAAEKAGAPAGETETADTSGIERAADVPAAEKAETPDVPAAEKAETPDAPAAEKAETPDAPVAETGEATDAPAAKKAETPDAPAARTGEARDKSSIEKAAGADAPVAETGEASDAPAAEKAEAPAETPKPKRSRAKKPPAAAPEFKPGPNGKRDEDVPEPAADPLTTRREQGS